MAPPTQQGSRGHRQRRRPGVVEPSTACRGCQNPSCRERGRHPTDTRKVGAHPRRAAGSPVVSSWLRLCRWTTSPRGPQHADNLTRILTQLLTSEVISTLAFSYCRKLERSGGCKPSAARRCSAQCLSSEQAVGRVVRGTAVPWHILFHPLCANNRDDFCDHFLQFRWL